MGYFKNIIVECAVVSALTAFAFPAHAGNGGGLVRTITVAAGVVIFQVDIHTTAPACGASDPQGFVFDGSTAEGKNLHAALIGAANGKKSVTITGTGDCFGGWGRETVRYFQVNF